MQTGQIIFINKLVPFAYDLVYKSGSWVYELRMWVNVLRLIRNKFEVKTDENWRSYEFICENGSAGRMQLPTTKHSGNKWLSPPAASNAPWRRAPPRHVLSPPEKLKAQFVAAHDGLQSWQK
ncbi:hypothetical protein HanIR_Chr07g0329161 [Helianthus annuus]|nr:hypothetical protein HanIR_Chr07g0329161 [Helianthus annuus]